MEHIKLMKERTNDIKILLKKCAVVLNSSITKNLVKFILKVKTPICEVKIFSTIKAAKFWLNG